MLRCYNLPYPVLRKNSRQTSWHAKRVLRGSRGRISMMMWVGSSGIENFCFFLVDSLQNSRRRNLNQIFCFPVHKEDSLACAFLHFPYRLHFGGIIVFYNKRGSAISRSTKKKNVKVRVELWHTILSVIRARVFKSYRVEPTVLLHLPKL
ncbi:hypothetical protein RHSIM_Rhsim09G0026200 [Rhododendron simsii]|uniref:Uncharacterized protein n=1 Tax=Rhododendron simsii TaxID=118357 RepID=A0A834LF78_RHOSS|nr:hypothetical protein RHSIM_Rhsim09G0026200 [Rhododendron simsii]